MWEELFREGSPTEIAGLLLLLAGIAFMVMVPIVWICGKVIALNERPEKRAIRTVSVAYSIAAFFCIFGFSNIISPWFGPLLPIPAAILIYLWLLNTYRKGWIDDQLVPEGTELENSDWRVGVAVILATLAAASIKVFLLR